MARENRADRVVPFAEDRTAHRIFTVALDQKSSHPIGYKSRMAAFFFTCPVTRFRVQSWSDDDDPPDDRYEGVDCLACTQVHFVDPKTGRVMGEEGD
jgi:hypothetical protein